MGLFIGLLLLIILAIGYGIKIVTLNPINKKTLQERSSKTSPLSSKEPVGEIMVVVKDPFWIFAYWFYSTTARSFLCQALNNQRAWEDSKPGLRVYENPESPQEAFFNIFTEETDSNWYIKTKPDTKYQISWGRFFPSGSFFALANSQAVTTPPAQYSQNIDPTWPPVSFIWENIPSENALLTSATSSTWSQNIYPEEEL